MGDTYVVSNKTSIGIMEMGESTINPLYGKNFPTANANNHEKRTLPPESQTTDGVTVKSVLRSRPTVLDILGHQRTFTREDEKRILLGQLLIFGAVVFFIILYIIHYFAYPNSTFVLFLTFIPGSIATIGLRCILKNNFSKAILCVLLREVNVLVVFFCNLFTLAIAISEKNINNSILGVAYFLATVAFVLIDTVENVRKEFILTLGVCFTLSTLYQIFGNTVLDWGIKNNVLIDLGNGYIFYKRSIKRSIYIEILCFSLEALWTLVKDYKERKLMMFGTGNVYRESGESLMSIHERYTGEQNREELDGNVFITSSLATIKMRLREDGQKNKNLARRNRVSPTYL